MAQIIQVLRPVRPTHHSAAFWQLGQSTSAPLVVFVLSRPRPFQCDWIGPGLIVVIGYAAYLLAAVPIFWLVSSRNAGLIILAMILALGIGAIPYAPIGAGSFPNGCTTADWVCRRPSPG